MDVLLLGEAGFPGREVAEAFVAAGHRVVAREARRRLDRQGELLEAQKRATRFDAVVDLGARSAADVRSALVALRPLTGHYLLVSSCEVYPNLPRSRPWSADALDLGDDAGLPSLSARARGFRSAERELRIGARALPWTVVRPAPVEGAAEPQPRVAWFLSRILDGGPLVLPDAGVPLYRHLPVADLAAALVAVAAQPRAFGQTLDAAGEGFLSPWGHAAMLMDGLGRRVPFAYVPAHAWRAAGLSLPYDDVVHAAFVEPSGLLHELGFRPTDVLAFTHQLAKALSDGVRPPDRARREAEKRLWAEARDRVALAPGARTTSPAPTRQWLVTGVAGAPASLRYEPVAEVPPLPPPLLRTRRLVLGLAERLLLAGELPTLPGRRALGHNALLELVEPGASGLPPGTLCLPLARLPCDAAACAFCREPSPAVLGLDVDGYGARFTTTPLPHLVPIAPDAGPYALLADPLACLLEVLAPALAERPGPVWIAGRTAEAALAGYLARDAGAAVRHLDHLAAPAWSNGSFSVEAIEASVHAVRHAQLPAPAVAVDLSGSGELARAMASVLPPGGLLLGLVRPPVLPDEVVFRPLPVAASGRLRLVEALERLGRWAAFRDLAAHLGPAVPPDLPWDALLPVPFSQPWLEERA